MAAGEVEAVSVVAAQAAQAVAVMVAPIQPPGTERLIEAAVEVEAAESLRVGASAEISPVATAVPASSSSATS
jgi:hypothetical protein